MEGSSSSPTATTRLKRLAKTRPDSLKIDLLTIPENGCVSSFDKSTDPVSHEVNVQFRDISYSVREGLFTRKRKKILDGINGDFLSGELTAIMGPSGSGKSTLMDILAGYITRNITGEIHTNEVLRDESSFRKKSCYIMQNDNLQPLLTVQEAMAVAASLKLASNNNSEKENRVKEILQSMSLWNHRKVRTESLSGGQKKRLSIALELLKNPQVMFFDEPTSGLDSLSSKQCVKLLKDLAAMGRTIICTIHQPSAIIFDLFDHLYVLTNGQCMYQGSVKGVLPYLEDINLKCPTYHNPADFYRMMKTGKITPVHAVPMTFPKVTDCDNCDKSVREADIYPTSCLYQILILVRRTFLIISRDRTLTLNRILTHFSIAIFIGFLYFGIGKDASTMLNNFNFMFFSVMFLMLTAFNCVTTTFPSELPILTREHFNKWYSLKSYYLAITMADIPIQICATLIYALITYFLTMQPIELFRIVSFLFMCVLISMVAQSFGLFIGACMDVKNGVIFGPFCFLPFTIFSGFFVQLNDCHPYMRWLFHISFLKYGFEGLVLSVLGYKRPKLPCNADYCHYVNPQKFLTTRDMGDANYSLAVIFLLGLVFILRITAYIALKIQLRRNRSKKN
ncbi:ATP-binding cassette sub-family G member 1-like isoform X2 [Sitophilus oryzae]|uniref:ATP-binding cassette sub-family G member 1-like isoform X2 n=1 Tax=Sitophilus oryzae TaxID=7048 RepID=A0A6J2XA46_SITOR|nr:ATP-binding cassette sub-family G member 1-like isoform X2 [Sitophilus oryzae]